MACLHPFLAVQYGVVSSYHFHPDVYVSIIVLDPKWI